MRPLRGRYLLPGRAVGQPGQCPRTLCRQPGVGGICAFGLDESWFASRNDRPTSALRVLRYPPGLQVQAIDGSWVEVHAPEGGFVVNVGDLLTRWTGGHWLSPVPDDPVPDDGAAPR